MAGGRAIKAVLSATDKASPVFGKVAGSLGALAGAVGVFQVGKAITAGFGEAIDASRSFEKSMSRVSGLASVTGGALGELKDQAKDLGRTTVFSAQEAADAMGEFAKAGFDAAEITDSIGPALDLAAAGQVDIAEAATIASQALRSFGKDTSELGHITDVMAKASTSATTTVSELGTSFRFVGAVAKDAGASFEDMMATMAALASAGIPVEQSAAQLRNLFLELRKNTEDGKTTLGEFKVELFDSEGAFVGMAEAIDRMSAAGINSTNVAQIFEKRLAAVLTAALGQRDAIAELRTELENSDGAAKRLADTFTDNLDGAFVRLKSATNGLAIEIGEDFQDALKVLIDDGLNPLINEFTTVVKESETLRNAIVRAAIGFAFFGQTIEKVVRSPAIQVGFHLVVAAIKQDFAELNALLTVGNVVLRTELERTFAMLGGLGESPVFDEVLEKLNALLNPERGEAEGPELDTDKANDGLGEINETVTVIGQNLVRWGDVLDGFIQEGVAGAQAALIELNDQGEVVILQLETLGDTLGRSLREIGVQGALELGDSLVDAAFGADVSFRQFFKNLLRDIAKAIVQALILKAILKAFGSFGGGGAAAGAEGGEVTVDGIGTNIAQGGALVAGGIPGRDSVPGLLMPGEFVVRKDLTDKLRELVVPREPRTSDGRTLNIERLEIRALDARSFTDLLADNPEALARGITNAIDREVL